MFPWPAQIQFPLLQLQSFKPYKQNVHTYLQQEWEAWLATVYKQIRTTKSQLTQCTKY